MRILIVDDEPNIRMTLRVALESMGHSVEDVAGRAGALKAIERAAFAFDAALLDLRLGEGSGLELMETCRERAPRLAAVIITAHGTIDNAVEAMRRGAFDYLLKPFTPAQVRAVLERIERLRGLQSQVDDLEERLREEVPEVSLRSDDARLQRVLEQGRQVAATDAAVLVRGESGTGKGVLARALHGWGRRARRPFVTVSCPSLSAELLESTLFGHARGAFTGAVADSEGKVAAAEGGTLFLDEIGDLPPPLQPKLLRFLQERRYERVGEARPRAADVRLVAATNRDIDAAVASGAFREDLLFRLNVVELALPPLRERSDRLELARHLLEFFARQMGKPIDGFHDDARSALLHYHWPGNLRELRNAMERAVIFARGNAIEPHDLPERVAVGGAAPGALAAANARSGPGVEVGGPVSLERLEAEHIRLVLERSSSREDAARVLGIDPSTLYRKRKQLGL